MWRCVVRVWTDVSEKCIASIFRVEKSVSEEQAWAGGCSLHRCENLNSYNLQNALKQVISGSDE
jgi:hypothetical protein